MGRWIDRAVLLALTAAALYVLFLNTFSSIPIACAFAFLCCAALVRLRLQHAPAQKMTRSQAKEILHQLAYDSDEKTEKVLRNLIHSDAKMIYLAKHPTVSLGTSDVFSAWKSHRSENEIILVSPCCAESRTKAFSRTLEKPSVRILDAAKLIPLIRKSDLEPPRIPMGKSFFYKMKELFIALPGRRPWHRNLLLGLAMMLVYLLSGRVFYLILSIGMLLLAGIGVRLRA